MNGFREVETTEEWRVRISCTPQEVPFIAPVVAQVVQRLGSGSALPSLPDLPELPSLESYPQYARIRDRR